MKIIKLLVLVASIFTTTNIVAQEYFEGEIHYKTKYETINEKVAVVDALEKELGNTFTAYVKEDSYAIIYHATGNSGWMKVIVLLKEGYSYREFEKSDTIIKTKLQNSKQKLLLFKRNSENRKEVLNEMCESITINYEPTDKDAFFQIHKGTYYFNPKYKLNADLYKNSTDGYWNLFVGESNAISIRNETEFFPLFKIIQEAVSIERKKIPNKIFQINKSKVIKEE